MAHSTPTKRAGWEGNGRIRVCPRPSAWKKVRYSDVAPVMAKLALWWDTAFFALDGGNSGRPSSCVVCSSCWASGRRGWLEVEDDGWVPLAREMK